MNPSSISNGSQCAKTGIIEDLALDGQTNLSQSPFFATQSLFNSANAAPSKLIRSRKKKSLQPIIHVGISMQLGKKRRHAQSVLQRVEKRPVGLGEHAEVSPMQSHRLLVSRRFRRLPSRTGFCSCAFFS